MGIAHRDAMGQCFKLEGEVEARNVQTRLGMTAEERVATPPWETEDVVEARQRWESSGMNLPDYILSRIEEGEPGFDIEWETMREMRRKGSSPWGR